MVMHGPMMEVSSRIADGNRDPALSFEEVTTIHKSIFDKVDANQDGEVKLEEVFMREPDF